MQDGKHDLERGDLLLGMETNGDSTTVVIDGNGVVWMHVDLDPRAVTRHRLIDRVVDNLPDKVMQPCGRCRTDIHSRTFTNGLKAFENLNLALVVRVRLLLCCQLSSSLMKRRLSSLMGVVGPTTCSVFASSIIRSQNVLTRRYFNS